MPPLPREWTGEAVKELLCRHGAGLPFNRTLRCATVPGRSPVTVVRRMVPFIVDRGEAPGYVRLPAMLDWQPGLGRIEYLALGGVNTRWPVEGAMTFHTGVN